MPDTQSIAVLMTSFNRRNKTLRALASLAAQFCEMPRTLRVFLVDDASSDGTREAVAAAFPYVEIIPGTGCLYWNGGMRKAFEFALRIGFDAYLWLNDDTELLPDALDKLLRADMDLKVRGITSIVAGSTCDPRTSKRSYGGLRRIARWNRIDHVYVEPSELQTLPCDTMNGNCTLIPAAIALRLGNLESRFRHHFGDIDYGYRAKSAGFGIFIVAGYVGKCEVNQRMWTWRDSRQSFRIRWNDLMSPKGYRFSEWFLFSRRHFGYLWPMYFASPYLQALFPGATRRLRKGECSGY